MPISDIGSYVTVGREFEAHAADVNVDRLANALAEFAWPDGYLAANLTADVDAVEAAITAQVSLDNALSIGTNGRDAMRVALRDRFVDFRKLIDYRLKASVYSTSLPATPHETASEQKFLRAIDDMADLWTRIDADAGTPNFTPPLVFSDGYALAALQTDIAALRTQYKAVVEAENDARMGRKQRDALLQPLRDRFLEYRQGIEVEYGEQHAFTLSLPQVTPAPGSTPDAVTASGVWDAGTLEGVITWTESSEANFDHYDVRMTPGATYDTENDITIFSVAAGTTEHRTLDGLLNSGDVASFKVYVVLTTANEAGSNTVTITRP